jgi:hypothetical protein
MPVAARRPTRKTASGIHLPRADTRTREWRRFRELVESYASELGQNLSEPEKALVAQISGLQLRIEDMQAAIVAGADVDADQVIRLSSEHRRLLASLRVKAEKAKPAPPTIDDLAAAFDEADEAAA